MKRNNDYDHHAFSTLYIESYLDEQAGHALTGVVISGYAVDHPDSVEQTRNVVHHALRVVLVEGVTKLL